MALSQPREWIDEVFDLAVVRVVHLLVEVGLVEAAAARSKDGEDIREVGMTAEQELVRISLTNWDRLSGRERPVLARRPPSQNCLGPRLAQPEDDLRKKGPPAHRSAVGVGQQGGIRSSGDVSHSHDLVAVLLVEHLCHRREAHNLGEACRMPDGVAVDS